MKKFIIAEIMEICPALDEKGLGRDTVNNLQHFLDALKK